MDQGIAILFGAIIGAVISGFVAHFTSKTNLKAVERTANSAIECQSKTLIADLERTGQEIKAKIGVEVLSKNRQEWINNLRKEVADYITIVNQSMIMSGQTLALIFLEKTTNNEATVKYYSYINPVITNCLNKKCLVELMLNNNEKNSNKIIDIMGTLNKLLSIYLENICANELSFKPVNDLPDNQNCDDIQDQIAENIIFLSEKTSNVLKEEWERVKKGV